MTRRLRNLISALQLILQWFRVEFHINFEKEGIMQESDYKNTLRPSSNLVGPNGEVNMEEAQRLYRSGELDQQSLTEQECFRIKVALNAGQQQLKL